jgi:hypothetical protein
MAETMDIEIRELSIEDRRLMLDTMAEHYLGMSGAEFERAWNAGEFDDGPERPEVMRVAMLLVGGKVPS